MADLVAGAPFDDQTGAVWILFMNADGSVKSLQKTAGASSKLKDPLSDGDGYGHFLSNMGDLDRNGTMDLVAAPRLR